MCIYLDLSTCLLFLSCISVFLSGIIFLTLEELSLLLLVWIFRWWILLAFPCWEMSLFFSDMKNIFTKYRLLGWYSGISQTLLPCSCDLKNWAFPWSLPSSSPWRTAAQAVQPSPHGGVRNAGARPRKKFASDSLTSPWLHSKGLLPGSDIYFTSLSP